MAGWSPADVSAAVALDVAYATIIDLWPVGADRRAMLTELEDRLTRPPWPDRDHWGEGTAAVEAQRAMMRLAGGPAPMRTPTVEAATEVDE